MSKVLPAITALGTTWFVEIFDEMTEERANETFSLVRSFLSNFENKYSRFNPDSLISTINRTKIANHPDQITLDILRLGQQLFKDTDGVFNILIGEHLLARGYDSNYSFTAQAAPKGFPSPLQDIVITEHSITLHKGQLDPGGYGKGFLLDQVADFLRAQGFMYFLINGGGDMYATSEQGKPIEIYLEHPSKPDSFIAKTTLKNQGFAASSTHKRRWKVSGVEYSHIVNTSIEKDTVIDDVGVYTKAPQASLADAWATTLLISDPAKHTNSLSRASVSYARFTTTTSILEKSPDF